MVAIWYNLLLIHNDATGIPIVSPTMIFVARKEKQVRYQNNQVARATYICHTTPGPSWWCSHSKSQSWRSKQDFPEPSTQCKDTFLHSRLAEVRIYLSGECIGTYLQDASKME